MNKLVLILLTTMCITITSCKTRKTRYNDGVTYIDGRYEIIGKNKSGTKNTDATVQVHSYHIDTKQPLASSITVLNDNKKVRSLESDSLGNFSLEIPEGVYQVVIVGKCSECTTLLIKDLQVSSDEVTTINVYPGISTIRCK